MARVKTKTHYVTLRLLFDENVTRVDAIKAAKTRLPTHTLVAFALQPFDRTKPSERRIVAFQIKRVC